MIILITKFTIETNSSKVKEIAKEDAARIQQEFADVGDDDILKIADESEGGKMAGRKTGGAASKKLPPLKAVHESQKSISGKQRLLQRVSLPNSDQSEQDNHTGKIFYKRKERPDKKTTELLKNNTAATSKSKHVYQKFVDRPKTQIAPQLANTVKSPSTFFESKAVSSNQP